MPSGPVAFLGGAIAAASVTIPLLLITPTPGCPDYSPPPGALNPAVTQATIGSTICVPGWTRTVRPSSSYTTPLKMRQIAERNLPGTVADYQLDHFIPLELGGAPRDPANLWPEPQIGPHASSGAKDRVENALKARVCAGTLSLADAQWSIGDPRTWGT